MTGNRFPTKFLLWSSWKIAEAASAASDSAHEEWIEVLLISSLEGCAKWCNCQISRYLEMRYVTFLSQPAKTYKRLRVRHAACAGSSHQVCLCKIEAPYRDEELMVRTRPRQQASRRLSPSSSGQNVFILPQGSEPISTVQSCPRPRTTELRRIVAQDRVVLVNTVTTRLSIPPLRQRRSSFYVAKTPCRENFKEGQNLCP